MRRPSAQPPIRSLPARAIALLSLGGYLLVTIGAPVWHLSGATCGDQCADPAVCSDDSDRHGRSHHCHAHSHPAQEPTHEEGAPDHNEADCSVCHLLAAKLIAPVAVTLIEGSEPAIEILPAAAPRPDLPAVTAVHSRGPPLHV